MFDNNFGKCGLIVKIFHQVIRKKILNVGPIRHLQCVATLPCES